MVDKRIVIIFLNYGPYHIARIVAFSNSYKGEIIPIQITSSEPLREWYTPGEQIKIYTIFHKSLPLIKKSELKEILNIELEKLTPDILVIAGYSHPAMRLAARWAKKNKKIAILMSDSQYIDRPRNWLKEKIKGLWIRKHFNSAFVSGARSAEYLIKLGFPADRIWRGYDVVDNDYFMKKSDEIRVNIKEWREKLRLPDRYFLYVGRFSSEKNLLNLLEAYKIYCDKTESDVWGLVLVGSGPQEYKLKTKANRIGLRQIIFPGFKQFEELPPYYALASCFILPSISETWGLSVNEAMASGLPVLVSWKCGCVPELVYPGINGYVFNPESPENIAFYMKKISSGEIDLNKMSESSRRIIRNFSPQTWAKALADCIEVTIKREINAETSLT